MIFHKPTMPEVNKSSLADFGFATGNVEFPASVEMKEYASRSVPGEDGERVFFPDNPAINAYDLSIEFKYKGLYSDFHDDYMTFCNFLIGRDGFGPCMHIYMPWNNIGRMNTYVKSIKECKYNRNGNEVFITFNVVFRITDPVATIKLAIP